MSSPAVVAAVDFGTTNTKLAFGIKVDDPNNPYVILPFTEWECAPGGDVVHVAPTSILLDETGEVDAYGWEAEHKYGGLDERDRCTYWLFKHFKMELHQEEVHVQFKGFITSACTVLHIYLLPSQGIQLY